MKPAHPSRLHRPRLRHAHHFRALLAFVATLLALVLGGVTGGAMARADEAIVSAPRDVPLVLPSARIALPALPSDFEHTDIGGWLHVSYPGSVHERVEPLLREANAIKARLTEEFGQAVLTGVEVRVARTPEQMSILVPPELRVPSYASGVAYPALHLVLLSLQDPLSFEAVDLPEVFGHELSHVALEDAVLGHHVPLWFNEGLAVHESGEGSFPRSRVLWDASFSKTLLPLSELDRNFPAERYGVNVAYAESADFVRFLLRNPDKARFASLIERVRGGAPFERAIEDAYGTDLRKLEYEWRDELSKRYGYMPILSGILSLVWVGAIGLMIVGWARRRRQSKAKLAQWEREDAAMDAELVTAAAEREAAHAQHGQALPDMPGGVVGRAPLPMIEHDGNWYTLH